MYPPRRPLIRPTLTRPMMRRPPVLYREVRTPLEELEPYEDIGSTLTGLLGSIPIVGPLVGGLLGGGAAPAAGGAAPAAGGAAGAGGGPMAGIGALLNDPAALATLGGIQGGGAASLLSAIRGNPTANATLGPLANAAIGAGLNAFLPGVGGLLGGALGGGGGGGGLDLSSIASLLTSRDLAREQAAALPREAAAQVAGAVDPTLASVRSILEQQQQSAAATAEHRALTSENDFRRTVTEELAAVRGALAQLRSAGPPRY